MFSPRRFSVCNEGFDCSFFLVWDVIYVLYINIWYNSKAVFIGKNKCLYALLILEAFCAAWECAWGHTDGDWVRALARYWTEAGEKRRRIVSLRRI